MCSQHLVVFIIPISAVIKCLTIAMLQAYEALINREEDVIKLKNGEIRVKNLPPRNRYTKNEAFLKYLSIFYDRPQVEVSDGSIKHMQDVLYLLFCS